MKKSENDLRKDMINEMESIWTLSQELSFQCMFNKTKGVKINLMKMKNFLSGKKPNSIPFKVKKYLVINKNSH